MWMVLLHYHSFMSRGTDGETRITAPKTLVANIHEGHDNDDSFYGLYDSKAIGSPGNRIVQVGLYRDRPGRKLVATIDSSAFQHFTAAFLY